MLFVANNLKPFYFQVASIKKFLIGQLIKAIKFQYTITEQIVEKIQGKSLCKD